MFVLLALVPLLLGGALLASRARGRLWGQLVAGRLRSFLIRRQGPARRWIAFGFSLLAFALVIAALTGPNAGYREEAETIRGRNLLLVIDISRSMLATDESPNRLGATRAAAFEVLERFPNDRIGIVAFSGNSWLQAPLTIDHAALRETLQQLDADTLPRGGSDLSGAILMAVQTLKETGQRNNAMIVFSDGETHEETVDSAAEKADEAGITIFTAGFGTEEGAFIPDNRQRDGRFRDRGGNLVLTRLQNEPLRRLARRTDGFYMHGSGKHFADNLGAAVEHLERFEVEGQQRRIPIPRFQWFLVPAIVFFIIGALVNTRWRLLRVPAAASLAILGFLPTGADGRLLPPTPAGRALGDGSYRRALELFASEADTAEGDRQARLRLGEGTAAYRLGEHGRALGAFSAALLSPDAAVQEQAHFALGNTLFHLGEELLRRSEGADSPTDPEETVRSWRDAIDHFRGVLELNPSNSKARDNQERVEEELEKLLNEEQPPPQEQPQEGSPDRNEDQSGEGETPPEQDPDDQGEPDSSDSGERPGDNGSMPRPGNGEERPDRREQGDPGEDRRPPESQPGEQPEPAPRRSDETPEEYARRVLSENADFQTNPLPRNLYQERRSSKDW